jgi:hypothetical protein
MDKDTTPLIKRGDVWVRTIDGQSVTIVGAWYEPGGDSLFILHRPTDDADAPMTGLNRASFLMTHVPQPKLTSGALYYSLIKDAYYAHLDGSGPYVTFSGNYMRTIAHHDLPSDLVRVRIADGMGLEWGYALMKAPSANTD